MTPERTVPHAPALKLARNSLILVSVEVIAKGAGMLVFIPMARIVGAADLGLFAFSVSLANLIVLFSRFGFERYLQRELARLPERFPRLFSAIASLKIVVSALLIVITVFVLWMTGSSRLRVSVVLLILISTLLYDVVRFLASCFRAFQRADCEAEVRLVYSSFYTSLGLLSLLIGWGVVGVAAVLVMAGSIAVALSARRFHRKVHPLSFSLDVGTVGHVLRDSFPLFLVVLVVRLYNQVDVILLSSISGDREVGIYAASMKIFEVLPLIPAGVMAAVLPALARDWKVSRKGFAATFEAAFRYLTMLALPLAVGGAICGTDLMHAVFGTQYTSSGGVLRMLVWATIFSFWNHLLFASLVAMDRERNLLLIGAAGVVASVGLNLILIPRYGAFGSGATVILTQAILSMLALRLVLPATDCGAQMVRALMRPALCTAGMAVVLEILRGSSIWVLLPIGGVVYFAGLLLSGALRWTEIVALLGRKANG